jgi:hypothetical protein
VVTKILQTWWHIEDIYFPSKGRRIRQVMDLATNESSISIDSLSDCKFVGLKIIARNINNKELSFLERKNNMEFSISINLDPLTQFPQYCDPEAKNFQQIKSEIADDYPEACSPHENVENLRQIKLEIDYILIDIKFLNYDNRIFHDRIIPKKYTTHEIQGLIHPEFYITLPQGWRISGKKHEGDAVILKCFIERENSTLPSLSPNNREIIILNLNEPFIKTTERNRTYNYLVNDVSYSQISPKITPKCKIYFKLSFESNLCDEIVGVSLFQYVFAGFSVAIFGLNILKFLGVSRFKLDCNAGIAYLIVLMGFAYYYGNLVEVGYDLPRRNDFIYIFIFTIFVILSIFITSIYYTS